MTGGGPRPDRAADERTRRERTRRPTAPAGTVTATAPGAAAASPGGVRGQLRLLWAAYAVSTFGTWFAFDAFPLVAILVLHAGADAVSALAAAGTAVGAAVAVPLGPWVEFRRKRSVMIAMDLVRFAALLSVPLAYAAGRLGYVQLLVVSVLVAAAGIAFTAASGAFLKSLVRGEELLAANTRFEAINWASLVVGPPLGGAAIGLLGPVASVLADAVSYLLSAVGIRAVRDDEPRPRRTTAGRLMPADLLQGWRHILTDPVLRPLFLNNTLTSSLIMAGSPVLAVLMLGRLGFAPWQYGLAFAVPCLGGLLGSRLSRPLTARHGRARVLRVVGTLRAVWPIGLALVRPGAAGLLTVMAVEAGLITCMGVFSPVLATLRLDLTPADRVARTLSAWSVTSKAATALMTGLWGLIAAATGPRTALALAGLLLLATPLLLPRRTTLSHATRTPEAEENATRG